MSTQNENLFVKLVKKSVGLPTEKSNCCSTPAVQSSDCCGSGNSTECCGAEASDALQSSGCGCGSDGCCGVEDVEESETGPSIGSSAI